MTSIKKPVDTARSSSPRTKSWRRDCRSELVTIRTDLDRSTSILDDLAAARRIPTATPSTRDLFRELEFDISGCRTFLPALAHGPVRAGLPHRRATPSSCKSCSSGLRLRAVGFDSWPRCETTGQGICDARPWSVRSFCWPTSRRWPMAVLHAEGEPWSTDFLARRARRRDRRAASNDWVADPEDDRRWP